MNEYPLESETILAALTSLYLSDNRAREVALLSQSSAKIEFDREDSWNGGTRIYDFQLCIPTQLFAFERGNIEDFKTDIRQQILCVTGHLKFDVINDVFLVPDTSGVAVNWRERAQEALSGKGITNQGRVRSDNIASLTVDGLLFRSQPEINLYQALKRLAIPFAPLPVFVKGGAEYKRIEPDFIILKDGVVLMVEVDGDTVHRETPLEAHVRATMLSDEGAVLERVAARECATSDIAAQCVKRLLAVIEKIKVRK